MIDVIRDVVPAYVSSGLALLARKHETRRHPCCPHVAEPLNTVSNLLFCLLAAVRVMEADTDCDAHVATLYACLFAAGICSAIHHATVTPWTIILDYIPIVSGVLLGYQYGALDTVTWGSLVYVVFAFVVLLTDHAFTPMPVPWGHCMWHVLAAIAFDSVIWDLHVNNKQVCLAQL